MACGDRVQISVTSWGICWKWGSYHIPARRRRPGRVTIMCSIPIAHGLDSFRINIRAVAGSICTNGPKGLRYLERGIGPRVYATLDKYLDSLATSIGDCPFNPPPPPIQ